MNTYLKAKATLKITSCKVNYEGSLTLDENIMDMLGVKPYEQVYINGKYIDVRIMTYLLPGKRGSKICEANGGAAQYFIKGDVVHLLFFKQSRRAVNPKILEVVV